jgi:hypothetical protein
MNEPAQPSPALKSGINGALIAGLVFMGVGFYVRATSDPDPAWTAFPTPIAMLLLGLRSLLLTPDPTAARTQRIVGGLLVALSLVLLVLNIVELNMGQGR